MAQDDPQIPPLREQDYTVLDKVEPTMLVSALTINETVPLYTPKQVDYTQDDTRRYGSNTVVTENPGVPMRKTELFLHDSYFLNTAKFFADAFTKTVFVWVTPKSELMKQCIDEYRPDVVVFEQVQRVLNNVAADGAFHW